MQRRLALVLALALVGCKGKLEKLSDQLAAGSVELPAPRCASQADVPRCLDDSAKFFAPDAKFDAANPDQASAAAAALLVFDGHGAWTEEPSAWIASMKLGKGAGADALRLAVARRLADGLSAIPADLTKDADGRALLAVAAFVPGACGTYVDLAAGAEPDAMPPERSPDHASCVQRDLTRGDGPGGAYGFGLWRGVAAGLALLKDAMRALDAGAELMTGSSRAEVKKRASAVRASLSPIKAKQVDRPVGNRWQDADHPAK